MLLIGHRGCRGLFPENTLMSFIEAIKLGTNAIELDVVVSIDKQLVVSHEPIMSQITCLKPDGSEIASKETQQFNLYQMAYKEIKEFDCGLKFHPRFPSQKKITAFKPLLKEVLDSSEEYVKNNYLTSISYFIEIKSNEEFYNIFYPEPKEYVKLILDLITRFKFKNRIILKSFDINILNEIKKQSPSQKISLLINRKESIAVKLKKLSFTPEVLGPYFKLLDKSVVGYYQKKGFQINTWTVNEISDIKRIQSYGVDGLITDYPDRLVRTLV
jgi:glycerophosphoryl diester phosphodiesterase